MPIEERDALNSLLHDQVDIKSVCFATRLDYCGTGNSWTSVGLPRRKWFQCPSCGKEFPIRDMKVWFYKNHKFMGNCPNERCQAVKIEFRVREVPVRDPKGINIIRWAPQQIDVIYNHITGISRYFYSIPPKYKRAVGAGDLDIIAGLPLEYLDAIKREMAVELDADNVFHMKKLGLAEDDQGWGRPDIQPALKTCFRTQVFAKANEAIALSRIQPWSIVSPKGTKDINVQTDIDLGGWRSFMEGEYKKHRDDGNRVTFSETGVEQTDAFGNAKELMMTAEYKAAQEEIIIAMGYPPEWVYGGLSYNASSLSIRSLELLFLRDREQSRRQVNFYIERIQKFLGRRVIKARFTELKMADDMQTRELMARLVMAQQMAMGPFLTELGKDPEANKRALREEMTFQDNILKERSKAQAQAQGEAQLIMTRYQNQAQEETAEAQRKFQVEQGIDMLTGMLGIQQDQQAAAAPAAGPAPVHTGISKSLSESSSRHQAQGQQAAATGQPPTIQQKAAEFILKDGGAQWVMGATAATLGALPPDARKRELERIRRNSPNMSVIVGDQLRRDNLAEQPNMRLDLTNRAA